MSKKGDGGTPKKARPIDRIFCLSRSNASGGA
jgi:hypothetical protein